METSGFSRDVLLGLFGAVWSCCELRLPAVAGSDSFVVTYVVRDLVFKGAN